MITSTSGLCAIVLFAGSVADAREIVSAIGDLDGFTHGDSADTPPRSSELLAALGAIGETSPQDLDSVMPNSLVAYSHLFDLEAGESVVSATLEVGVRTGTATVATDFLALDRNITAEINWGVAFGPRAVLADLLGDPPTIESSFAVVIDLGAVMMRDSEAEPPQLRNLLNQLHDGIFNVILADDSGVDYSILRVQTIPAAPVWLGLGSAALVWRRARPSAP